MKYEIDKNCLGLQLQAGNYNYYCYYYYLSIERGPITTVPVGRVGAVHRHKDVTALHTVQSTQQSNEINQQN